MKFKLGLLLVNAVLLITLACGSKEQKAAEDTAQPATEQGENSKPGMKAGKKGGAFKEPTEIFIGTVNGTEVEFAHKDYTKYRWKEGGVVTKGELNTERGFQSDGDATLFIINSDKPESEQKYLVRYTDGRIVMLDTQRKVVEGVTFVKK